MTIMTEQDKANGITSKKAGESFFTQCEMRTGRWVTVGWIPTEAAKKGNEVRLLASLGEGREQWKVTEVYGERIPQSEVLANERRYKDLQGSLRGGGIDGG